MPRRMSKGRTGSTEIVIGAIGRGAMMAAEGLERPQARAMEAIILGKSVQQAAAYQYRRCGPAPDCGKKWQGM